jgi:hypothetical protein
MLYHKSSWLGSLGALRSMPLGESFKGSLGNLNGTSVVKPCPYAEAPAPEGHPLFPNHSPFMSMSHPVSVTRTARDSGERLASLPALSWEPATPTREPDLSLTVDAGRTFQAIEGF